MCVCVCVRACVRACVRVCVFLLTGYIYVRMYLCMSIGSPDPLMVKFADCGTNKKKLKSTKWKYPQEVCPCLMYMLCFVHLSTAAWQRPSLELQYHSSDVHTYVYISITDRHTCVCMSMCESITHLLYTNLRLYVCTLNSIIGYVYTGSELSSCGYLCTPACCGFELYG